MEFTEEDTGPCRVAFHCRTGKMPEGLGNGCPLGANTDYLVLHDKWGSLMKENTALLKSTHIEEATRNPKEKYWRCLTRGICTSFFLLPLPKGFLNISQYFSIAAGPKLPGSIQQR